MNKAKAILLPFFCFLVNIGFCQQIDLLKSADQAYQLINKHNRLFTPEKIHLQLDKSGYVLGDTLWFKAYVLDASFFGPTSKSGILYVELSNDSTNTVVRKMVSLNLGLGDSYFPLSEKGDPGNYTIRAYTNWIRNFDEAFIFKKRFTVANLNPDSWLVQTTLVRSEEGGKEKENVRLLLNTPDGDPVSLREMQLKLMDGKRPWYQNAMQTDIDGIIDFNFLLPDAAKRNNLSLQIQDLRKNQGNRKLNIPLLLSHPENVDLQFMPEGGCLVTGLPAVVAFKAIDETGKSVEVKGGVYNSKDEQVTFFQSSHRGMGSFHFLPQTNETYVAKVELPGGQIKIYPIPEAKSRGLVMQVKNTVQGDSLLINIIPSTNFLLAIPHYLIAQARSVVCFAGKINPIGGLYKIAKSDLPTGLTRLTIVNSRFEHVNERRIFINHQDQLQISIQPQKKSYTTRDSVALKLTVTDHSGKPVRGSFSLSVTDRSQVKSDSLTERSILTDMLLCSEIRGNVEDPSFYFSKAPTAEKSLNLLMLTQAWVSYDWKALFKTERPRFDAEPDFSVRGQVTNLFNKGIPNAKITLYSKRPFQVMDTLTDVKGDFAFRNLYPLDTASYFIQSRKLNGNSAGGILLEEFKPPSFPVDSFSLKPWYVNNDSVAINAIKNKIIAKKYQGEISGIKTGRLLKEVGITAKRVIPGSKNLNGPGESDEVFDKDDMTKAGKMTLLEFLEKNLKGFGIGEFPTKEGVGCRPIPFIKRKTAYTIYNDAVKVTIDGVDIDFLYALAGITETKTERYEFMRAILGYYTAEDIKGVELMRSRKFAGAYEQDQLSLQEKMLGCGEHFTFLEITTYSGKGPFMKSPPGVYLYRPIAFSSSKQFYSPKYPIKNPPTSATDIRSTLHWEPNIITDIDGKAFVSFYTSDNAGLYGIYCEGTDLTGGIGLGRSTITVRPEQRDLSKKLK